jgi:hypothetical protein
MLALFLAIRVVQGATLQVLIVEALVGAAILSVALALNGSEPHGRLWQAGIAAFGSVLALVGLAL